MIKNVVVINDFDYIQGGASKIAIQNANVIARENKDINVYFFCGKHDDSTNLDKNIKVICLNQDENLKDKNRLRGIINGIYNKKAYRTLIKLLKSLNPDETIIHVHGWTKVLSSSVFKAAFKLKFKLVLTLHDYFSVCPNGALYNFKKGAICKKKPMSFSCMCCNCDSRNYFFKLYRILRQDVQNSILKGNLKNVITISDLSEKLFRKHLTGVKYYRVYNPIDLPISDKTANGDYYVYVGRIDQEKGVDAFCTCIEDLGLNGIVVGDGKEYNRLKDKYKSINFVGWKNKNDIIKYLSNSKALIFPSVWYETAGLTILEALSQGVPCYVRETTAGAEFIKEGENGCLFKDVADLKKKIIENKDKKFKFVLDNKEFLEKTFYIKLMETYNNIIGGE